MLPAEIIGRIVKEFYGVMPKSSWGETSLFYNPNNTLPNGVYFCTLKEKDGANDKSSKLDRPSIFRFSIGLSAPTYETLFGAKPKRPGKARVVATGHDFTSLDELMPHPVYGWMGWAQVISPSHETFTKIFPLIAEAHSLAVKKFEQKVVNLGRS